MDETDDAIAKILSDCRDGNELTRLIRKHATIVQYLGSVWRIRLSGRAISW